MGGSSSKQEEQKKKLIQVQKLNIEPKSSGVNTETQYSSTKSNIKPQQINNKKGRQQKQQTKRGNAQISQQQYLPEESQIFRAQETKVKIDNELMQSNNIEEQNKFLPYFEQDKSFSRKFPHGSDDENDGILNSNFQNLQQFNINNNIQALKLLLTVLNLDISSSTVHRHITCDVCNATNFTNYRYKCMICYDFDMCGDCFEERSQTKLHKLDHPVFSIPFPPDQTLQKTVQQIHNQDISSIQQITLENGIVHENSKCKDCNQVIEGIKFKCDSCYDYQLCFNCRHNSTKLKNRQEESKKDKLCKHDALHHPMIASLSSSEHIIKFQDITQAQLLGKGCFGAVYKVKHPQFNQPIVCKVYEMKKGVLNKLNKKQGQINERSFRNQLKILHQMNCNNSIRLLGYDVTQNQPKEGVLPGKKIKIEENDPAQLLWLLLEDNQELVRLVLYCEWMQRGSLQDILYDQKKSASLSFRRKLEFCLSILKALRVYHRKGIVHKDIKPDNILIDKQMQAKVGDFGIVVATYDEDKAIKNYVTDQMAHKDYIPPQLKGRQSKLPTTAADIYQFGLLLNQLFTGVKTKRGEVQQKSELFKQIIDQCLLQVPEQRPSAAKLLQYFKCFNVMFWIKLKGESGMSTSEYISLPTSLKNQVFSNLYKDIVQEVKL